MKTIIKILSLALLLLLITSCGAKTETTTPPASEDAGATEDVTK